MLFPRYNVAMPAVEANNVIGLRCRAISQGDDRSFDEINLMCIEKQQAFSEACFALSNGASANVIVELFRTKVAANQLRLGGLPS